jgi:hypothetical protein
MLSAGVPRVGYIHHRRLIAVGYWSLNLALVQGPLYTDPCLADMELAGMPAAVQSVMVENSVQAALQHRVLVVQAAVQFLELV